ncbi:MAG: NifB/NifX family molybdenum-iron cluster-binding protein [Bacteroidota bacterium]|nr:NifB/NifX family molybdenum-iron cluster-binding protein [Bacteroidota bacterium]
MKIAFTATGSKWNSRIDPRFGRTDYLLVYDTEKDELESYDNRDIRNETHGAGPKTAKLIYDTAADILITGNGPGENAALALEKAGVKIYTGAENMKIKEALEAFNNKQLKEFNI